MNKLQYIKLLELRGVSELKKGQSLHDALESTGGEATYDESIKVDLMCNSYYSDLIRNNELKIAELENQNIEYKRYIIKTKSNNSLTINELKEFLYSDKDAMRKFTCGDSDLSDYEELENKIMEQEDSYSTWYRTCKYKGIEYIMYYSVDNRHQDIIESDEEIVSSIQEN